MNYLELQKLLTILKEIPDSEKRDEAIRIMLQAASDNITFESLQSLLAEGNPQENKQADKSGILLELTKKEISKIPMKFRKDLIIDGRLVRCRKRVSGKNTFNYELRYRRNGYNIQVSSNDLVEAKCKFIQALQEAEKGEQVPVVPTKFCDFADYYFNKYRVRKVASITLENDLYRYNKHIKPYFGTMQLRDITPMHCQRLLDELAEKGQTKTNNEVYSLLNGIFKMAIAHGIILKNPLAIVIIEKHQRTHGTALTKEEEKKLLDSLEGTRYQMLMAVALYTGLRPNEYKTAKIEGDFIVAKNSKRKNSKIESKKIPIIPMLRQYISGVDKFDFPRLEYMRDQFNKILPNHVLYDLRTTFYTRCEECGVAPPARDEYVGHSRGELNNTYSDLSDEYLLKEGQKLVW